MAILTLEIENSSVLEQLKSVLKLMRGVKVIETKDTLLKKESSVDVPNAVTMGAMREAESGHDAGKVMTYSIEAFVDSLA